jgi:hypothetical protein
MKRLPSVGWVCLPLSVVLAAGCIQRHLHCPPAGESASSESVVGTGTDLIGAKKIQAFTLEGSDKNKVTLSIVAVTGQPFTEAVRADVKEASGHEWAVQIQAPTIAEVKENDVLLATFYVKGDKLIEDANEAETQVVLEESSAPYEKAVTYDVVMGTEWRKIHVPFVAHRSFAAGKAHVVFRLGYDPETIEIGGVTVENFADKVHRASLPTTRPWSPPKTAVAANAAPVDGGPLAIELDPAKKIGAISPYVYGVNSQPSKGLGVTVRRMGGNRQSAYNWEINASNAGSDYRHSSDDWPCTVLGYTNCGEPAAQFLDFAADNKKLATETLATVPMLDYVAADKKGDVSEAEKAPSSRWDKSKLRGGNSFPDLPDLGDGTVYEDEFVHYLVKKLGKAEQGGIKFYSLDNEPALWPSTHPRIHPQKTTYREMAARTEATAAAITALDPGATVLGGVMFGWNEYKNLSDAPDAAEFNSQYETYVDYYLASMKALEEKHHRRLVHVLDVHWYPEARGSKRITENDFSPKTVDARVQAPRSLWDPGYREKSWIDDDIKKPIRLLPWLEEKIAKRYPGTKLSMTEYDFGAGGDISGGIAQADVLGIFGREGLYLANYWGSGAGNGELPSYIAAAFALYRNYDGQGHAFGDTEVGAKTADVAEATVYAATDSKRPGLLTFLVLNKSQKAKYTADVVIRGAEKYAVKSVYRMDKNSPNIQLVADKPEVKDDKFVYALPPLSATLFVCEKR